MYRDCKLPQTCLSSVEELRLAACGVSRGRHLFDAVDVHLRWIVQMQLDLAAGQLRQRVTSNVVVSPLSASCNVAASITPNDLALVGVRINTTSPTPKA